MSAVPAADDPPVHAHQINLIHKLWATRKLDTKDIAERTGLKEHQVYRFLHVGDGVPR